MKKITLICLLLLLGGALPSLARSDRNLIIGNYYYTHGSYSEAIPHLEKAAAESGNAVIYSRLADCYYFTNNRQNATKYYSKAVAIKGCKKEVFLRHAQLLTQLEQYDEAEKWLREYAKTIKKDTRIDNLIEGCRTAKALSEQMPPGIASLLPFNTDGSEFAPTLWKGLLVFASDSRGKLYKELDNASGSSFYSIYSIACDKKGNCSGDVKPLVTSSKLNIAFHNAPCTFSGDGMNMYYTRTSYRNKRIRRGPNPRADSLVTLETMIAYYDTVKRIFTKTTPFQHNSKEYAMAHPAVSPDGRVMALSSNMPKGQGRSDIYICKKMAGGNWSKPVNAGAVINTEGDELFPYWADNNTLCFSSDGHTGLGGLDIYTSTWDEKGNTFATPVNIGIPINSSFDDMSLAIHAGELNTWFSSNRPAAAAGDNIFFYRKMEVYLRLQLIDSASRQPLPGITLATSSAHTKKEATTGNDGSYFVRLWPGDTYSIDAHAEGYIAGKTQVLAMTPLPVDTFSITLALNKIQLKKDTAPSLVPETIVMRNQNVMDSPGIHNFTQDATYEVGDFKYEYNSYELNASHQPFLDTMIAQLRRHPTMRIEIQARTDCRGSVASNKVLSDKRALSVVNYFVKHGISRKRLEYIGLGNTKPKAYCPNCNVCTEKEHSLNRILEFRVLQL